MTSNKMLIYADGSCLGNPGVGGWAAVCVDEKLQKNLWKIFGNEFQTTNNRMELTAIIRAIQYLKKIEKNIFEKKILIHSDSNLVIQTLNKGWKKKANLDLWMELDEARKGLDISYYWVKGHADDRWNNYCDQLAQQAAKDAGKKLKKNPDLIKTEFKNKKNSPEKIQESLF